MGPSAPEPLSPLLCMHLPKPITIQGCNTGSCDTVSPTLRHAGTQTQRVTAPSPTEGAAPGRTASPAAAPAPKSSQLQINKWQILSFWRCWTGSETSLTEWLLSRCVWTPPTGAVGDGGPEERHRALHRVHRPAPQRGHSDRSDISFS